MFRKLPCLLIFSVLLYLNPCLGQKPPLISQVKARGNRGPFTVDFSTYKSEIKYLPIGVFDSGLGGLTVLARIIDLDSFDNSTHRPGPDGVPDFAAERFIYLGDQANMPYGNYPAEGKTEFLRELALKDAIFLFGRRYWPHEGAARPRFDKPPVKAVVIACNTATAYGLEDLLEAVAEWDLPVYVVGVVDAGAVGALETIGEQEAVAVMATVGTCSSLGYVRAVGKVSSRRNLNAPTVVQQGCLGLAGAIEGDRAYIMSQGEPESASYRGPSVSSPLAPLDTALMEEYGFVPEGLLGLEEKGSALRLNSVENYIRYHVLSLVEKYREQGIDQPIGAVILGCTHFPFYRQNFVNAFDRLRQLTTPAGETPYRAVLSPGISFIDPAEHTALELYTALAEKGLLLAGGDIPAVPTDEFYISVPDRSLEEAEFSADGAFTYEYKYGRDPGRFQLEYVRRVPMHKGNLNAAAIDMIKNKTPELWRRLVLFDRESPRLAGVPDSLRLQ